MCSTNLVNEEALPYWGGGQLRQKQTSAKNKLIILQRHDNVTAAPRHDNVTAAPRHDNVTAAPRHDNVTAAPHHIWCCCLTNCRLLLKWTKVESEESFSGICC